MTKSKDNFVKFNEWLDTCPFGDYITNKLDYNPKTKYWEFKCKIPNVSKALNRTRRRFDANIIRKRFFVPEEDKCVTLNDSTAV